MGQGSLFGDGRRGFIAYVDGGSRGNPGPAAAGWVIIDARDELTVREEGLFLGSETNNRAEYMALLFALEDCLMLKADEVTVRSDSELMVRQMRGEYRVKNSGLKGLYARAKALSQSFAKFQIEHVRREDNRDADRMVNVALDEELKKTSTPRSS